MALGISMLTSAFAGVQFTAASAAEWAPNETGTPQYMADARQMEQLNRGLIAVYRTADNRSVMQDEAGVYLSWRLLGDESLEDQAFDIYKNGTKIATTGAHDATNYIDTSGTKNDRYKVVKAGADAAAVEAEPEAVPQTNYTAKGNEVGSGNSLQNSFTYVDIPIDRPDPIERDGDGAMSYYYGAGDSAGAGAGGANDASVGDLDGDGDYEIVLKWDPTDSRDSADSGYTGRVYIDGYEIDPNNGGRMWRIDLGPNVTAGAHYTQFIVYDFDNDGRSEIAMQTAPGSKDGLGNYVSEVGDTEEIRSVDNERLYIGTSGKSKGKNIGPEYYTIFDGETGAAISTTAAIPMGNTRDWGDKIYNRSHRFLAGVAYLDGVYPSLIECRGYYAKAVVRAYKFDGANLTMQWEYVGDHDGASSLYGQGNHNLSIADIDNDGCDEIVYGSAALDNDGKTVLGNTRMGHGDALHVSDFNNDGIQEAFSVKEETYEDHGGNFRVVGTGETIFDITGAGGDVGRGVMDNIDDAYAAANSNALALGWTSAHQETYDLTGQKVAAKPSNAGKGSFDNFLIYWDGDLSRELLDSNVIQKYDAEEGVTRRFYGPNDGTTLVGGTVNNSTKRNPSLVADIWGDWREEVILPVNKESATAQAYLRIYTSTIPTEYRLTTLMHDSQYRCSVAWQNVGYNQPTHQSYYIGSAALAKDDSGNELNYLAPKTLYTQVGYDVGVVHVNGIEISDTSIRLEKSHSYELEITFAPEDATRRGVIWESTDPDVASVYGGVVTAKGPGTATITATSRDGGFVKTCEVEVWSTPVTGIAMEESCNVPLGGTAKIDASVEPANASVQKINWTSSNPEIASVDDDGTVTGRMNGAVLITGVTEEGGYEKTCVVNVVPTDRNGDLIDGATTFLYEKGRAWYNAWTGTDISDWTQNGSDTASLLMDLDAGEHGRMYYNPVQPTAEYSAEKTFDIGDGSVVTYAADWYFGNSTGRISNFEYIQFGSELRIGFTSDGNGGYFTWVSTDGGETWNDLDGDGTTDNIFDGGNDIFTVPVYAVIDTEDNTILSFSFDNTELEEYRNYKLSESFDPGTVSFGLQRGGSTSNWNYPNGLESLLVSEFVRGAEVVTPEPPPEEPEPPEELVPVEHDVTAFTVPTGSRVEVSAASGNENEITFTNAGNANNGYAAAYADISGYIEGETTYSVEYDSYISSDSRARIALADTSVRPAGSNKNGYVTDGVAFVQGMTKTDTYNINESDGFGNLTAAQNAWVHTSVTVNTLGKTISFVVTDQNGSTIASSDKVMYLDSGMSEINGIEYFDTINDAEAVIKNVKVITYEEYTEPEPTPPLVGTDHPITEFSVPEGSRIEVSEASGSENEITFTNAGNANNAYAAAYADLSGYTAGETMFTVEYDSNILSGSRARIALVDTSVRPADSNKNGYVTDGVAFVQGMTKTDTYNINESDKFGNLIAAQNMWVHTSVTVNAEDKTISFTVTDQSGNMLASSEAESYLDGDMTEINGIEFFDTINNATAQMKNVTITTYSVEAGTEGGIDIVSAVRDGENVRVTVESSCGEPKTAVLAAAGYDGSGALAELSVSETMTVAAGGSAEFIVKVPSTEALKLMLWEDLDSITPYTEAMTELE